MPTICIGLWIYMYAVEIAEVCNNILLIEGHQRRCEVRYSNRLLHTLQFALRWLHSEKVYRLSSQCYCTLFVLLLHHRCKQRRCYCSISRINNRRFSSQINPPARTIYFLKSINSYSILSHTGIYPLGVSLCYSATSSTTGKSVRHLEWVRNSCYCIEVLPRVRAVPRLFMGCFEQKSYIHSGGPVRALCNAIQSLPVRTGLVSFNSCIISLWAPYRFTDQ